MPDAVPADAAVRPFESDRDVALAQAAAYTATAASAPRRSLGPGFDFLIELAKQCYRPALGAICLLGLSDHFLFATWFRHGQGRLDEVSLMVLVSLAGALAGMRVAELTFGRR